MDATKELIIVRSLTDSDLGLFAAHREGATSRQRAININAPIAERMLSRALINKKGGDIKCICVYRDVKSIAYRHLGKIHKNWRLGGKRIEGESFAELDSKDFMLIRSIVRNDGLSPIAITFVGRRADRVIHAGIAAIVQRGLKNSMIAYETGEPAFADLAKYSLNTSSRRVLQAKEVETPANPLPVVGSSSRQGRLL